MNKHTVSFHEIQEVIYNVNQAADATRQLIKSKVAGDKYFVYLSDFINGLHKTHLKLIIESLTWRVAGLAVAKIKQKAPCFEGKVYNVRFRRMIENCLKEAVSEILPEEISATAYVEWGNYSLHSFHVHYISIDGKSLPDVYGSGRVRVSFSLRLPELLDEDERIKPLNESPLGVMCSDVSIQAEAFVKTANKARALFCQPSLNADIVIRGAELTKQYNSYLEDVNKVAGPLYYHFRDVHYSRLIPTYHD